MEQEELLNLSDIILNEEEEFFMPIRKLLQLILQEKENWELLENDLLSALEKDGRFKVFRFDEKEEYWDEEEDPIMEGCGFYRGPRVVLLSKNPTKDDLMRMIEEKSGAALEAFKMASNIKQMHPEDSDEDLLALMIKSKELKEKINEEGDE